LPSIADAEHPANCTNCGAPVAGKYCSACGQSVEYHLHSLWDLLGEAAEVLTHADSRLWRTLVPLLFRPGFLTQQFLAGRRASYIPPFRLYLVVSVLFFLVVSLSQSPAVQRTITVQSSAAAEGSSQTQAQGKSAAELCESLVGHTLIPGANKLRHTFLDACIKSQADNGRALRENFIRNIGRSMFLFLPLLAAFMKLLYWRPKRSYVTHLVLLLHNHAFVFLLIAIVLAEEHWFHVNTVSSWPALIVNGYIIYYLYRSMRRVYAQGWWRTLIKFAVLSAAYLACALCTVLLAGLYSAESL
jgi:hypothetical protein